MFVWVLCVLLVMWFGSEHVHKYLLQHAALLQVGPGFRLDISRQKSEIRFARHRTGYLASKTKTVGAFGKAGKVDTICISLLRVFIQKLTWLPVILVNIALYYCKLYMLYSVILQLEFSAYISLLL